MMVAPIGVVIVTFNSESTVPESLQALMPQLWPTDELVVIDNASGDGSAAVAQRFGVEVVRNGTNRGFAAAVNQGMARLHAPLVLLLNPDVVLSPEALAVARRYMDDHLDVDVLGACQVLPNGRIDPAAHRSFKTPATYFYRAFRLDAIFPAHPHFGRYYKSTESLSEPTDVDSVVGAFMLVRNSALDLVGRLDERFFMYCEDEDLCWRVKSAGGRVVFHPGVVARHAKGSSARTTPLNMTYHWHRSVFLYHRKNIAPRFSPLKNAGVYALIGASLIGKGTLTAGRGAFRRWRPGQSSVGTAPVPP